MYNVLKQYLLIIAFILSSTYVSADNVFASRHISSADGLSSNIVHAIVQDKDGYMWFGTVNGLCRFDGYSFVNYTSLSPDPKKHIVASIASIIADNERGLIWVTTPRNQIACFDINTSQFADYSGKNDYEKQYRRLLQGKQGMWLYDTRLGARLVEYDKGTFHATDYTSENGMLASNHVVDIVIDKHGCAWIATDKGITMVTAEKKVKQICKDRKIVAGNTDGRQIYFITNGGATLTYDKKGRLTKETADSPLGENIYRKTSADIIWKGEWLLFTRGGTYGVNLRTGKLYRHGSIHIEGGQRMPRVEGFQFVSTTAGNLWIFPDHGKVKKMKLLAEGYNETSVGRKIRVCKGHDGKLYLATQGNGLYVYNPKTENVAHYSSADRSPLIASNSLLALATDHTGSIWVAGESAGVTCLSTDMDINVQYLRPKPNSHNYMANLIKNITPTNDGFFSISTNNSKLYQLTADGSSLKPDGSLIASAYAYYIDAHGNTWIGTRGGGLYFNGQIYNSSDSTFLCPTDHIYDIKEDCKGRIWIATWGSGLLQASMGNNGKLQFRSLQNRQFNEKYIRQIFVDSSNRMWLATNDGLAMADCNQDNISDSSFVKFKMDNGMLPSSEIMCITMLGNGTIWLGTQSLGVIACDYSQEKGMSYKVISTEQGLINNNVRSILEDDNGQVWVTTEDGLSRINIEDQSIRNYRLSNEMMGNVFSEDCASLMDDGRLLLGTTLGLAIVTPNRVGGNDNTATIRPTITDLRIGGISIFRDENLRHLAKQLQKSEVIRLNHDQSSLSFHFSNFAYKDIHSSLYQYWLEGSDEDWLPASSKNHADYGKLPPGQYTLHLKSMAGNSKWSEAASLEIIISEPWYNTWWAWAIYLIIIACAAYYIYRSWRRNFELHQQMVVDKQLNDFRINFFTHIAHEFRTPLALIQGAVDKLVEPQSQAVSRSSMQTVRRGTSRLLRLVNQLMEFRKINTGNLRLAVEPTDIIDFVRNIYQDFWQQAKYKNINITFQPFANRFIMPVDRHKLETITYNLLSNAVKYTPENGSISVRISQPTPLSISISIADTGPGISLKQQKNLFQPFMHGYVSQGGMGIGLYNAHSMAVCHHGQLTYTQPHSPAGNKTAENLQGSTFTVTLPTNDSAYHPDEYKTATGSETAIYQSESQGEEIIQELLSEALNHHNVAIIEDDPDMMQQIRGEIGIYFNVQCYSSGLAACSGILEQPPALILCDVMLPDIDGYEIVRRIRKDEGTINTPVIMLTALDDETHQLKAYRAGADDYITKPCNFKLLVARISRMIEWAERTKPDILAYTQPASANHSPTPANSSRQNDHEQQSASASHNKIVLDKHDKLFRERVEGIIARHISDPLFTIDTLATEMCMGRTKFYGKVKELMGVSPNKMLMNERMRIAAELLKEGRLTVSEVAYKTGFDNQSYFNKCFKKYYGMPPGQYRG